MRSDALRLNIAEGSLSPLMRARCGRSRRADIFRRICGHKPAFSTYKHGCANLHGFHSLRCEHFLKGGMRERNGTSARTLKKIDEVYLHSGAEFWEAAIADAEQQAIECEQRGVKLRAVADVFKRKRNAGEPWPGSEAENAPTQK